MKIKRQTILLIIAAMLTASVTGMTASAKNTLTSEKDSTAKAHNSVKSKKQHTITLWGHVKNSFTKLGVPNAFVTLMREDSTVVDTAHVGWNKNDIQCKDTWYRFTVPATPQKYIIKAQHPDYKDCYVDEHIKYVARNTYFDAPWHFMKRKDKSADYDIALKEVVVKATKVKLVYKGDTLVYNADAFNVPQGSMLDELVKQLPGVELKDNGEITVNGRKVDFLTLNGEDFFKGKNKVMLDNMPYYTVKNIRVYDKSTEKSKYLGSDVEQKDYVMDVQLKREYSKGYLANVEGAKGTEDRYMSRLFGLRFTDHSRLALFGNVNNVNETRSPSSKGEWSPTNRPIGYTSIKTAGAGLVVDDKDKRYKEVASAQLSWTDNEQQSRMSTTTYLTSGSTYALQRSANRDKNYDLNLNNEFTINKPLRIFFQSNVTYKTQDRKYTSGSATFNSDPSAFGSAADVLDSMFAKSQNASLRAIAVNRVDNRLMSSTNSFSASQNITADKKLPWGDDLELHYDISYNTSKSHSYNIYQTDYYLHPSTDYRNVINDNSNRSYHYNARAEYTIHLLNNWNYVAYVAHDQSWTYTDKPRYRLDYLDGWGAGSIFPLGSRPSTADSLLMCMDAPNSMRSTYLDRNSRGAFRMYYSKEYEGGRIWFNLHLPVYYRQENEHYIRNTTDTCFSLRNWFFQPDMTFQWFSHNWNRMVYVNYSASHQTPNVEDMVSVRDDSNPLTVYLGNPNLENTLTHNFNIAYRNNVPKYQQSLYLSANGQIIRNKVVNGYSYDSQTGVYTYQPDNVNGNWNASTMFRFSRALDKTKHWMTTAIMSVRYDHIAYLAAENGVAQSNRCTIDSRQLYVSLEQKYQMNTLTAGVKGNYFFQHSSGSLSTFNTVSTPSASYGPTLEYTLPWNIQLATDFNVYILKGLNDAALNKTYYMWNASLSRAFFHGHMICKVEGFDILRDLSQVSYNTNADGFSSSWSNGLTNYVMVHLSYKINVMPKKK